jgi:hypothetical protein
MNDNRRLTALAGAGVVAALVIAFAVAAHAVRADGLPARSTPAATVQSFLSSALVDQNPVTACSYLTPRARKSFERPGGQDCASFIASARLNLGGHAIVSNRQLDHLTYTVVPDKNARIVHVAHTLTFVLRPASAAALAEFQAPPTDWRIDSSVAALGG